MRGEGGGGEEKEEERVVRWVAWGDGWCPSYVWYGKRGGLGCSVESYFAPWSLGLLRGVLGCSVESYFAPWSFTLLRGFFGVAPLLGVSVAPSSLTHSSLEYIWTHNEQEIGGGGVGIERTLGSAGCGSVELLDGFLAGCILQVEGVGRGLEGKIFDQASKGRGFSGLSSSDGSTGL
jgi:hypothetical protein